MVREITFLAAAAGAAMAIWHVGALTTIRGRFSGRHGHRVSGGVTIESSGDVAVIRLDGDFRCDGSPDPVVGLGRDGQYDPATLMGRLRHLDGAQDYTLPCGVDLADYNEIYVWCRAFALPVGVARIA